MRSIFAKLLKRAALGMLLLVGLWMVAGWGLALYCRLATKTLSPVDDSDLRVEVSEVPDAENAAAAFLAMSDLIQYTENDRRALGDCQMVVIEDASLRRLATKEYAESGRREVDRVLREHAEGLAELHRLAALPHYQLKLDAKSMGLPPVSMMTWANTLWELQSIRARERGDLQLAFSSDCDSCRFFTQSRDHASGSVEMMVACGMLRIVHRRMVRLASAEGATMEMQRALADLLRDDPDEGKIFEQTLKREYVRSRQFELHEVEKADRGNGPARLGEMPGMSGRWVVWGFSALPGFSGSYWRFAYNPEQTRQSCVAVWRAGLAGKDSKAEFEALVPEPQSVFEPNWVGMIVARNLTPSFDGIRQALKYCSFSCRAARVAIAVQRYRRAHGSAYPADLSELVPAFLDKVPQDPFAPERKLACDLRQGIVWTVGPHGDFDPLVETVHDLSLFDRKMSKNALRLDGKAHEPRAPRKSKK